MIELEFASEKLLRYIEEVWLAEPSLLLVTEHEGCNPEFERSVYKLVASISSFISVLTHS